jgi:hypothetical protein
MIEGRRGEEEAYRSMVEDEKKKEGELNAYHEFDKQLALAVPAFFHAWFLLFPVCPLIAGTISGEPYLSCSTDKELSAHRVSTTSIVSTQFHSSCTKKANLIIRKYQYQIKIQKQLLVFVSGISLF